MLAAKMALNVNGMKHMVNWRRGRRKAKLKGGRPISVGVVSAYGKAR